MDLASLLFLASGEATEKAPFYILGGALAAWAVVLSVFGLVRSGFPGGTAGERGVIGISTVLVVATIAAAVTTASG